MWNSAAQPDRSILGFVDALSGFSDSAAVMDAMHCVLAPAGAEFFCFNFLPQPDERFEDVLLASRLPAEWLRLYVTRNYVHDDPAIRHCGRTAQPFERDAAPFDPVREPRAAEVVQHVRELGLVRGCMTPIPSPSGPLGSIWVAGAIELTPPKQAAIHLTSLYAFDRLRALKAPSCRDKSSLTTREREVLRWIAGGKSAWEIGEILAISKRTVDEHTQSALRKLGAANRAQAVAIAMRDHIVAL
jgi:LuxR family quorum sensing-dependent transcriptional regulator